MSKRILKTIDADESRIIDLQLIDNVISKVITWEDGQEDYQYSIEMWELQQLIDFLEENDLLEVESKIRVK